MSLTSISEATSDKSADSDLTDDNDIFDHDDDEKKIGSDALSWLSKTHPDKERGEFLMKEIGNVTAEDIIWIFHSISYLTGLNILYLMNYMSSKEQEKVIMAVRARSEIPRHKEKSMSGIPDDLLYAIMNKTDVGIFLSEKMRYPPQQRNLYINLLTPIYKHAHTCGGLPKPAVRVSPVL